MTPHPHTIPGLLALAAADAGAERALIGTTGDELTFGALFERAVAVARHLADLDVALGDRVAIWAPNSVEWVVAHAGALFAGASVVPVNTRYTVHEAAGIVTRSRAGIVFAAAEFLGRAYADEIASALPDLVVIPLAGGADPSPATTVDEIERRMSTLAPDDISHVQYTSGTTGRPKGAMLRHGASVRTTQAWVANVGLRRGDVYPVVAPFSHLGGHKTGLLACLVARASAIPVPVLDVGQLTELVRRHGATFLQGPPTLFVSLLEAARVGPAAFTSLRACVTGGAVVPPALVRDIRDVLGVEEVFTAYGLTESTGVCTMTRPGDDIETVATTCGQPLDGIEIDTLGPDGSSVGVGERGEVVVRGDSLMGGYLDNATASADAIRDGWLHTGDIGILDVDGRLRIVDRLTDMIVVGGLNVYPAEVEHVLIDHSGVLTAAVVGAPDDRLGEVPVAFVVTATTNGPDAAALRRWCEQRLARFKIPRRFVEVAALPLNASGKVAKPELRESAAHALSTGAATP